MDPITTTHIIIHTTVFIIALMMSVISLHDIVKEFVYKKEDKKTLSFTLATCAMWGMFYLITHILWK